MERLGHVRSADGRAGRISPFVDVSHMLDPVAADRDLRVHQHAGMDDVLRPRRRRERRAEQQGGENIQTPAPPSRSRLRAGNGTGRSRRAAARHTPARARPKPRTTALPIPDHLAATLLSTMIHLQNRRPRRSIGAWNTPESRLHPRSCGPARRAMALNMRGTWLGSRLCPTAPSRPTERNRRPPVTGAASAGRRRHDRPAGSRCIGCIGARLALSIGLPLAVGGHIAQTRSVPVRHRAHDHPQRPVGVPHCSKLTPCRHVPGAPPHEGYPPHCASNPVAVLLAITVIIASKTVNTSLEA